MTRQQRLQKLVGHVNFWNANPDLALAPLRYRDAKIELADYIARNVHLVTIQSGNGVQEAIRERAR